ncbi:hypothetical protein [Nocardiopsis ganjiahuensis]|uniref:hypothetical protein n=1 Tax=Nocardiopsis ganjiahuensis TaxID=239984 RepID=UPI000346FFEF|nr:hypothetical protein [Nocardiopsis ganjiahuensis]
MPDSTVVHWDADQQRWTGDSPPARPSGRGPGQPNVPAVALAVLLLLLVVVAIGVHTDTSANEGGSSASSEGEPSEDECADSWGGDLCDDEEDQSFFPDFGPGQTEEEAGEEEPEEDPAPDGFELRSDPNGFELHVPEGWRREDEGPPQGVFYSPDGRYRLIQVMEFAGEHSSPQAAMDSLQAGVRDNADYSDLGQTRLGGGTQAVELNYAYEHGEHGLRDVHVRTFLGGDGEVYAVLAAGPVEEWDLTRQRHEAAADSFCVTVRDCP